MRHVATKCSALDLLSWSERYNEKVNFGGHLAVIFAKIYGHLLISSQNVNTKRGGWGGEILLQEMHRYFYASLVT
jgi:hypothetical protein